MKRALVVLLLFVPFLSLTAVVTRAQTATVTGHVLNPSGSATGSGQVCFTLLGYKPQAPRVVSVGTVVQQTNFCVTVSSTDGSFSTSLYQNAAITPSGTFWRVDFLWNNIQQSSGTYSITSSPFNLDTATPIVVNSVVNNQVVGANNIVFTQTTPASTWTIVHNLTTQHPQVICYDSNNHQIFPDDVSATSSSTVTVSFVGPQTGSCSVMTAGYLNLVQNVQNVVITNPPGGTQQNVVGPLSATNFIGPLQGNASTATSSTTATNLVGPGTVSGSYSHGGTEFFASLSCKNFEQIRCVDNTNSAGWSGSDPGAWINAAEADLPATGGIIDARGLTGAQTATTPIVFYKLTKLILGAVTLTGPSSGDVIQVYGGATAFNQGSCIVGQGQNITTISPVTGAQGNGIYFAPTTASPPSPVPGTNVNGNTDYCVYDLSIEDSTQGGTVRSSGVGILAGANASPAQNSVGMIQNVTVGYMFNGIVLQRPITTTLTQIAVQNAKQDGVVANGDGTTVTFNNVFSNGSGRYGFNVNGINAATFLNGAAQSSVSHGIVIARDAGGDQPIGTVLNGTDIEVVGGDGVHCTDCYGLAIIGINVINSGGDGVHIDGGRGVNMISGEVKGSTGCGLNLTQSATPVYPDTIMNMGLVFTGNTGGNECGGSVLTAAYSSLGYDGSGLTRLSNPPVTTGSAATIVGTGACSSIDTQVGGAWGGSFRCTGSTGASTVTITIGTSTAAPNGWACTRVGALTAGTNTLTQSSWTTGNCVLSGTVTTNDKVIWTATGF